MAERGCNDQCYILMTSDGLEGGYDWVDTSWYMSTNVEFGVIPAGDYEVTLVGQGCDLDFNVQAYGSDSPVHMFVGGSQVSELLSSEFVAVASDSETLWDSEAESESWDSPPPPSESESEACVDGDGVDAYGDGCDWYDSNAPSCGGYDSTDFTANYECCACGGGNIAGGDSNDTIGGGGAGGCVDTGRVDSYGDGCDWYDSNPTSCGAYDHSDFTASQDCCACSAGFGGNCVDGLGTDSYGDGCDWYDSNPDSCGAYDTQYFFANSECCACQ